MSIFANSNLDMSVLLKEIERLKLQKTLIKVGFREDIPDILNAINVFCLPSLWEGLSISLLEAMAMKKAIVATSTDGTKDVINDGVNGIIVNFNKPNELAESYIKFYNQKDLYNIPIPIPKKNHKPKLVVSYF